MRASPVARAGLVFVGRVDGKFHATRVRDGGEAWMWSGSTPLYGEALVSGDSVRFVDEACAVVGLAEADGKLRWRAAPVAEKSAAKNPTFNHRTVVPVLDAGITAPDRRTGAVKWRHVVPLAAGAERAGYLGSLARADGKIAGAGFDGTLVAFPAK